MIFNQREIWEIFGRKVFELGVSLIVKPTVAVHTVRIKRKILTKRNVNKPQMSVRDTTYRKKTECLFLLSFFNKSKINSGL